MMPKWSSKKVGEWRLSTKSVWRLGRPVGMLTMFIRPPINRRLSQWEEHVSWKNRSKMITLYVKNGGFGGVLSISLPGTLSFGGQWRRWLSLSRGVCSSNGASICATISEVFGTLAFSALDQIDSHDHDHDSLLIIASYLYSSGLHRSQRLWQCLGNQMVMTMVMQDVVLRSQWVRAQSTFWRFMNQILTRTHVVSY